MPSGETAPKWRDNIMKRFNIATLVGGAAIAAIAFGPIAVASAEWDIGVYDSCSARTLGETGAEQTCCGESDGVMSLKLGECTAPPEDESAPVKIGPSAPKNPVSRSPASLRPNPLREEALPTPSR
jgi:hypothetical protein